jgi:Serine/threonine protein kinase
VSNETEASTQEAEYEPINVQLIGRSSTTASYQCTLPRSQRPIVLKLWANPFIPYSQIQQSYVLLQEEIQTLKALKHAHILTPLYIRRTLQSLVFVNDYFPHSNLQSLLQQYQQRPLPRLRALSLIHQLGEALQAAHQVGIIHGNLTPYNVLFRTIEEPDSEQQDDVLLSDFYVPSLQMGRPRTREEDHPLLRLYMAPEQFLGFTSPLVDQYELGCLAYQLFTGHLPYEGAARVTLRRKHSHDPIPRPTQFNTELPTSFDAPLMKALAKDPAHRFVDIAAFLAALDASEQAAQQKKTLPLPSITTADDQPVPAIATTDDQPVPIATKATADALTTPSEAEPVPEIPTIALDQDGARELVMPTLTLAARPDQAEETVPVTPTLTLTAEPDQDGRLTVRKRRRFFLFSLSFLVLLTGLFILLSASSHEHAIGEEWEHVGNRGE